ncbi:MAG: dienelactone hydrolase family protein [Anaplasmataceae bacterium]|nr:dienelactone hydrolase family protein [Anaplasmataceae bacterium]
MDNTTVFFQGATERLMGHYSPVHNSEKIAIIFPPHPKSFATSNNKVVKTIARSFFDAGFSTLRPNFRTQDSSGYFNKTSSISEEELIKDAVAAIDWMQDLHTSVKEFWIGGFSFGGWLTFNLLMRRPEITGFISVSPLINNYDCSFIISSPSDGLIICGEKDKLISQKDLKKIAIRLNSKNSNIEYLLVKNGKYNLSSENELNTIKQSMDCFLNKKNINIPDCNNQLINRDNTNEAVIENTLHDDIMEENDQELVLDEA